MSRKTLILILSTLLLSVAGGLITARFDAPVRAAVVESQGKGWKKSDEYKMHGTVREFGDWPYLMLYGGISLLVAWKLKNRDWTRIIIAAMLASTIAGIIANASRLTTGRTRPRESPKIEQGFYGPWHDGRLTIGESKYNSFPSGHTATAFAPAWVIFLARPWLGIGALILAGVVGWSSIMIGAHHPSDVVVSIIISLGTAWYVWRSLRLNGDRWSAQIRGRYRTWKATRQKAKSPK